MLVPTWRQTTTTSLLEQIIGLSTSVFSTQIALSLPRFQSWNLASPTWKNPRLKLALSAWKAGISFPCYYPSMFILSPCKSRSDEGEGVTFQNSPLPQFMQAGFTSKFGSQTSSHHPNPEQLTARMIKTLLHFMCLSLLWKSTWKHCLLKAKNWATFCAHGYKLPPPALHLYLIRIRLLNEKMVHFRLLYARS